MTMDADEIDVLARHTYLPERLQHSSLAEAGRVFDHSSVCAGDGRQLDVFEAGDRSAPTILLVNALGMSVLFLAAIAKVLSQTHHVITWETRSLPSATTFDPDDQLSLPRHAQDAADIVHAAGCAPSGILTYCSGVNIALCGLIEKRLSAPLLCIVSPSIELPVPRRETDYQRTMLPIWRDVAARGLSEAALIHRLLNAAKHPQSDAVLDQLHALDRLPFVTPETTCIYAHLQAACHDKTMLARVSEVRARTLVLHCCDDTVIHADTAKTLADTLPHSSYAEIDRCGHFGIYTSEKIHDRARAFFVSNI